MTPCKQRGWKVGDKFKVIDGDYWFKEGEIIELEDDDGTVCPFFIRPGEDETQHHSMFLSEVEKIEEDEDKRDWERYLNFVGIVSEEEANYLKHMEKAMEEHNDVWHPSHYTQGSIECIDAIKAALTPAEFKGFLKGQVMKYTWRMGLKGSVLVDAQKAKWYMDTLNQELEEE